MEADISIWQKSGHFYFALTCGVEGKRGLPLLRTIRAAMLFGLCRAKSESAFHSLRQEFLQVRT